jgi:hypothetical protein
MGRAPLVEHAAVEEATRREGRDTVVVSTLTDRFVAPGPPGGTAASTTHCGKSLRITESAHHDVERRPRRTLA